MVERGILRTALAPPLGSTTLGLPLIKGVSNATGDSLRSNRLCDHGLAVADSTPNANTRNGPAATSGIRLGAFLVVTEESAKG